MRKLRVAFPVIKAGTGSDVYFSILQEGLRKLGVDADVIGLPYRFEFFPGLARKVRLQLGSYDLIHTNADYGELFRVQEKPLVVTAHHDVFNPVYRSQTSLPQNLYHYGLLRRRLRRSFQLAEAVICPSNYSRLSFAASFPDFTDKLTLIYNGVDTNVFYPRPNVSKEAKSLIMVGSYSRRKGSDLVPALMDKLPEYRLTWVTAHGKRLPKRPNIRYVSQLSVDELANLYTSTEICISLSRLEGFGYTVAEAMACGTPVVCTSVSSFPEVVRDGESGFLVSQDDVDGFVAKIKIMSAQAQASYAQMTQKCIERVKSKFSIELMTENVFSIYEKVTSSNRDVFF